MVIVKYGNVVVEEIVDRGVGQSSAGKKAFEVLKAGYEFCVPVVIISVPRAA